jgi:hypothetical protein
LSSQFREPVLRRDHARRRRVVVGRGGAVREHEKALAVAFIRLRLQQGLLAVVVWRGDVADDRRDCERLGGSVFDGPTTTRRSANYPMA